MQKDQLPVVWIPQQVLAEWVGNDMPPPQGGRAHLPHVSAACTHPPIFADHQRRATEVIRR